MNLRTAWLALVQHHALDRPAALQLESLAPWHEPPPQLQRHLWRTVAVLAAALGGLGIVMWIASNWDTLGRPARFATREGKIAEDDVKAWEGLNLLTSKPVLYVCNVAEGDAATGNKHTEHHGVAQLAPQNQRHQQMPQQHKNKQSPMATQPGQQVGERGIDQCVAQPQPGKTSHEGAARPLKEGPQRGPQQGIEYGSIWRWIFGR